MDLVCRASADGAASSASAAVSEGSGAQRKRALTGIEAEGSGGSKQMRLPLPVVQVDGDDEAHESTDAYLGLSAVQKAIIKRMVPLLDSTRDSVVITNPLAQGAPIVHVTQAWQAMCGYTTRQACGQNPRLTQGVGTDPSTIRMLGNALSQQKPCKVRLLNYRGATGEAFWNCLTIHPVFHKKQLVLFAARLQDYSFRLNRLVSVAPVQFCKSDDSLICRVSLSNMRDSTALSMYHPPAIMVGSLWELDAQGREGGSGSCDEDNQDLVPSVPSPLIKRLAFPRLRLEPEYLCERLRDECEAMHWGCQASEVNTAAGGEVVRLEVIQPPGADGSVGVRALVHVLPEAPGGEYSINITRLQGDTFSYHKLFRQLRERLADILAPPSAPPAL